MNYRERRSHARGVYTTQYTSSMGTARVKQESSKKSGRKERGRERETRPN